MRILIAHSFYRIGGGEDRYVRRQVALLASDHQVDLLERRNIDVPNTVGAAARMTYSTTAIEDAEQQIDAFKPDVVHVHNIYPGLGPAIHIAAQKRGVPLVMTVHNYRLRCPNGYMFTEGQLCQRCQSGNHLNAVIHRCFPSKTQSVSYATALWLHRFVLRLEKKVALFIAPSNFMSRRLVSWGIDESRTRAIPNFVDPIPDASAGVGGYGLFVGRLSAEKGVDNLLRALKQAGDPPFRIAGEGPLAESLLSSAAQLGLENTTFLGLQTAEQVTALMRGARFLALPSISEESSGLAAIEAMAAGRPLLVSDRGGLPELIADGTGVSWAAGDEPGLARHIGSLMTDDSLCREMGTRSLHAATTRYSADTHLAALEDAYRDAVA